MNQKYALRLAYLPENQETQLQFLKYIHGIKIDKLNNFPSVKYLQEFHIEWRYSSKIRSLNKFLKRTSRTLRKGMAVLPGYTENKTRSLFPNLKEITIPYLSHIGWNTVKGIQKLQKITLDFEKVRDNKISILSRLKTLSRMKFLEIIRLDPLGNLDLNKVLEDINSMSNYPKAFLGFVIQCTKIYEPFSKEASFHHVKNIGIVSCRYSVDFYRSILENQTSFNSMEALSIQLAETKGDISFIRSLENYTKLRAIDCIFPISDDAKHFLTNFTLPNNIETISFHLILPPGDEIFKVRRDQSILELTPFKQFINAWNHKPKLTSLKLFFSSGDPLLLDLVYPHILKHIPTLQHLTIFSKNVKADLGIVLNQLYESNCQLKSLNFRALGGFSLRNFSVNANKFPKINEITTRGPIDKLESIQNLIQMMNKKRRNPCLTLEYFEIVGYQNLLILKKVILAMSGIQTKLRFHCYKIEREEFVEYVISLLNELEPQANMRLNIYTELSFEERLDRIGKLLEKESKVYEMYISGDGQYMYYRRKHGSYVIHNI